MGGFLPYILLVMLPSIAITGWAQDADKARSRAAGFDHHLTKPIEPDALIQLLAE